MRTANGWCLFADGSRESLRRGQRACRGLLQLSCLYIDRLFQNLESSDSDASGSSEYEYSSSSSKYSSSSPSSKYSSSSSSEYADAAAASRALWLWLLLPRAAPPTAGVVLLAPPTAGVVLLAPPTAPPTAGVVLLAPPTAGVVLASWASQVVRNEKGYCLGVASSVSPTTRNSSANIH